MCLFFQIFHIWFSNQSFQSLTKQKGRQYFYRRFNRNPQANQENNSVAFTQLNSSNYTAFSSVSALEDGPFTCLSKSPGCTALQTSLEWVRHVESQTPPQTYCIRICPVISFSHYSLRGTSLLNTSGSKYSSGILFFLNYGNSYLKFTTDVGLHGSLFLFGTFVLKNLFICIWLYWVFLTAHGLSPVVVRGLLMMMASLVAELRL